jgi:hypothetical protein
LAEVVAESLDEDDLLNSPAMTSAISRNFSPAHAERRSVETEGDSRFDEAMMMPNEIASCGLKMSPLI